MFMMFGRRVVRVERGWSRESDGGEGFRRIEMWTLEALLGVEE